MVPPQRGSEVGTAPAELISAPDAAGPTSDGVEDPLTGEASAAGGDLEMRVQAGWEGSARLDAGGAMPVVAEVTNRGNDADLVLQVLLNQTVSSDMEARGLRGSALAAYERPLSLARGETKRVTLHVSPPSSRPVQVFTRLLHRGRVVAEAGRRPTYTKGETFIGVLSDRPEALSFLRKLRGGPAGSDARVIHLTPEILPYSPLDLDSFNLIVADGFNPAALTEEQRSALLGWVRRGGSLFLGTGAAGQQTLGLLPAAAGRLPGNGIIQVADLSALSRFGGEAPPLSGAVAAADLTALPGTVLAGGAGEEGGPPLLVEKVWGDGRILINAFSLTGDPFAGWPNKLEFLSALLAPEGIGTPGETAAPAEGYQYLTSFTRSLPAAAYPPPARLGLILLAFAALAGPVNYFLLRRLDRRDWTWLTVPALALAAVGGIYSLAMVRDGRDVLVNTASVLVLQPDGQTARQESYVGIFAPLYATLALDIPPDLPVRPRSSFIRPELAGADPEDPPFRVIQGTGDRIEFGPSTRWQTRYIQVSREVALPGSITGVLRMDGLVLRGLVTNETGYPLEDAGVTIGAGFARLGDLAPGESREVSLPLGDNQARFGPGLGWLFFELDRNPGRREVPPTQRQRANWLNNHFNRFGRGEMATFIPLTFFGFTRRELMDLPLPGAGRHRYSTTLLTQSIPLEWEAGPFTLPPNMAFGRFTDAEGSVGFSPVEARLNGGSVVAELWLPLPPDAEVDEMTIHVDAHAVDDVGGRPPRALTEETLQIYNWETRSWDALPGRMKVAIPDPARYVSPDLVVRVRFTSGEWTLLVRPPTVEVRGTLPHGVAVTFPANGGNRGSSGNFLINESGMRVIP